MGCRFLGAMAAAGFALAAAMPAAGLTAPTVPTLPTVPTTLPTLPPTTLPTVPTTLPTLPVPTTVPTLPTVPTTLPTTPSTTIPVPTTAPGGVPTTVPRVEGNGSTAHPAGSADPTRSSTAGAGGAAGSGGAAAPDGAGPSPASAAPLGELARSTGDLRGSAPSAAVVRSATSGMPLGEVHSAQDKVPGGSAGGAAAIPILLALAVWLLVGLDVTGLFVAIGRYPELVTDLAD